MKIESYHLIDRIKRHFETRVPKNIQHAIDALIDAMDREPTDNDCTEVLAQMEVKDRYPITWFRTKKGGYVVRYGQQQKQFSKDEDIEACHEFGECVRHAIECNGEFKW